MGDSWSGVFGSSIKCRKMRIDIQLGEEPRMFGIGQKLQDYIKYDGALQILIWVRNLVDLKLITQRQRLK